MMLMLWGKMYHWKKKAIFSSFLKLLTKNIIDLKKQEKMLKKNGKGMNRSKKN